MTNLTNQALSPASQLTGTSAAADMDVLAALRSATRDRHAWLDAHVPLATDHPDAADYVRHVQMVGGWLVLAAPMLAAVKGVDVGDGGLAAIRDDLAEAGASAPDAAGFRAAPDADFQSPAFAWGVAYVAEGSRLGGQMLFKRLAGPLAPLQLRYLDGRGDQTGAHWRLFMQALRAAVTTPEGIDAACRGAVWSFDALIERYEK